MVAIFSRAFFVVDSYPIWHPLMTSSRSKKVRPNHPSAECGYHGLDHTVLFAHGFITCPEAMLLKVLRR